MRDGAGVVGSREGAPVPSFGLGLRGTRRFDWKKHPGGSMRLIDLDTWPRKEHFAFFKDFGSPHFNVCADVDTSEFREALRGRGVSLNAAIIYVLARAANDIPEFRQRIRGDTVVEHEKVHPASTILVGQDLFSFCHFDYTEDFATFVHDAAEKTAEVQKHPTLKDPPGRDDLLYMSAIPWITFTSFAHPMTIPADSVPRFAWGKVTEIGGGSKMPLSVQGHHALVDGIHVAWYFERVQEYLWGPEWYLGAA